MTADQNDRPEQPFFHVGDGVPESGIYRVYHSYHREPQEVTLLRDEVFPRCAKCDTSVHFELIKSVPGVESRNFCVRLYNIPSEESEAA
ncbi:MAG TPA: hypothetical protein VM912_01750 [Terriglobales bacterium]|nr:hypothetical protein [Terriglobales bacterium]